MERRLEDRITEFELPNGLHFIVMERHNAPIVSVHTYAKVGAFDEEDGQTGMCFVLSIHGSARVHLHAPHLCEACMVTRPRTAQLHRHCASAGAHGIQGVAAHRHARLQRRGAPACGGRRRCQSMSDEVSCLP